MSHCCPTLQQLGPMLPWTLLTWKHPRWSQLSAQSLPRILCNSWWPSTGFGDILMAGVHHCRAPLGSQSWEFGYPGGETSTPCLNIVSTTIVTMTILSFLLPTLLPYRDDEVTPIRLLLTPSSSSACPFLLIIQRGGREVEICYRKGMTWWRNWQPNSACERGEDGGDNAEKTTKGGGKKGT